MQIDTNKAAELYNKRFDELGRNIKTVGWGSIKDQELRFDVLFRGLDPTGKAILDVGCGLGDLVPYLEQRTGGNFSYIGVDVAGKLISDAQKNHGIDKRSFYVGDLLSVDVAPVDIAVMSGALSFKVDGIETYAYEIMEKMFALSGEAACLNFLTSYVDFELEKNQHYQPETVFTKAKALSKNVNLFHDYPLYEFTIQVIK
jgi:SAM-dependent methyltransferase